MPRFLVALICAALIANPARADPVRIFAAGSLTAPLAELIAAAKLPVEATSVLGPSGLLMQRIAAGEKADLMFSADTAGPERMAKDGRTLVPMVPFARNRMCVFADKSLGLEPSNLLGKLLSPELRLATSTPGADPGGDYAVATFRLADAVQPGAGQALEAKALHLVGGPDSPPPVAGHSAVGSIFATKAADAMLAYCSGAAALLHELPNLVSVPVLPALEPHPVYGLAVVTGNPDAMRFALFVLSDAGQAILARNGLLPVLAQSPAAAR